MPMFLKMKMSDKTPCLYTFKMRMKTKTYEINFLIVNRLQLNIFSYKLLVTKKFIP
jgi:hypothetical protein